MSSPESPRSRRLVPIDRSGEQFGVTGRTMRRYVALGHLPAYKIAGRRGLFVDLTEAEAILAKLPRRAGRASGQAYGPRAQIRELA